jgi:protein-tyrosine kinase
MDHIGQALERVRQERKAVESAVRAPLVGSRRAGAPLDAQGDEVRGPDRRPGNGRFVYTRTRVFTPLADVLEANRILDPAATTAASAGFRMLRTQVLQRMDANGWRSLAIFGPTSSEGKTTTAINLAISLANDHRHSVLLADFDFRRPAVARRLGLSPEYGADDVLTGAASLEDCLYHPAGFERFVVLPARSTLMNSSEVLASYRTRQIVDELRSRYPERIVLFDLPPVLSADDALAFAPLVECGLVVVAESRTRRNDLVRTMELLHKTSIVGTVLNQASAPSSSGY